MITCTNNTRGFTLIELLVVITIIGILATGATTVYTAQIQKARDTTRIGDLKALQNGVEQVYQDSSVFPTALTFATGGTYNGQTIIGVTSYVPRLPKDPKMNQTCNNGWAGAVICVYSYKSGDDKNGIAFGAYEVSTAFEALGNVQSRAVGDTGEDDRRLEAGTLKTGAAVADIVTVVTTAAVATPTTGIKLVSGVGGAIQAGAPTAHTDQIIIYGN